MISGTEELVKWLKLTRVPKLGPTKMLKLFNLIPEIDRIFSLNDSELIRTRIFSESMILDFHKLKEASDDNFLRALSECEQHDISIFPIVNKKYPLYLKNIPYPPLTLFLKGNLDLLKKKKIAIVGSRKAEDNAIKWTYSISQDFVNKDYVVVSGGAIGIDYSAHRGALDAKGNTICVLGSGFFKMFPEKHSDLFKEIGKKGLLISEHLPNFPGSNIALVQRNRITSGLSGALIIVASGERGGSMVQTKMAFEQKIPIFCPKKSLNLLPNKGISQVINDWNGIEIETYNDVIKNITNPKKSTSVTQMKLKNL